MKFLLEEDMMQAVLEEALLYGTLVSVKTLLGADADFAPGQKARVIRLCEQKAEDMIAKMHKIGVMQQAIRSPTKDVRCEGCHGEEVDTQGG